MRRRLKSLLLAVVITTLTPCSYSQVAIQADLASLLPELQALTGHALLFTADITNAVEYSLQPVSFQVSIDSDLVILTTGRILGGGTAWAFPLGPATRNAGQTLFSGTTEMSNYQIGDMLAGRTSLEVLDEVGQTAMLVGKITSVPEPSTLALLLGGAVVLSTVRDSMRSCPRRRNLTKPRSETQLNEL